MHGDLCAFKNENKHLALGARALQEETFPSFCVRVAVLGCIVFPLYFVFNETTHPNEDGEWRNVPLFRVVKKSVWQCLPEMPHPHASLPVTGVSAPRQSQTKLRKGRIFCD
jgi:hypothetical protein